MIHNAPKTSTLISQSLTLELIDSIDAFRALENDWNELYEKCERNSLFSSWDWMFTWWEVFKDQYDRKLFIIALYEGNNLVGLAPFQICTPPSPKSLIQGKTLYFIGNGEASEDSIISESQDFIVLPKYKSEMVKQVSEYLVKNNNKWDFADIEFLQKNALVLQCFNDTSAHIHKISRYEMEYGVRFYIPKMDDFEQYQESMGNRWRKMLVKKGNKLSRAGEVKTIATETQESIMPAIDKLAEMNCSRWREIAGDCIFDSNRFVEFHQKILSRLIPKNKAAIRSLTLDNEVLASYYIFMDKNRIHYYQSGFNREYGNRYSPLFLLVCNEIGESIKENQTFEFMFADEADSYKKEQYSCEHEPMYRLRWSSQKHRLPLFHTAKYAQNTIATVKQAVKEKLNKKRGK